MSVELKLAIHMEPGKPSWSAYERWAQKLGELSGGEIKIKMSYSGIIGIEEWNNLLSHHCDIARVFTMNMEPFPMHSVPALPYLMPPGEENLAILNRIYDKYLYREWTPVKVLWLGLMSPYHLHTVKKPVHRLEDFRGLRLQTPPGLVAQLVTVWGGIPVDLTPTGEKISRQGLAEAEYSALKTGAIDGLVSTFEVTKDFKLYEVTRYHTYLHTVRDVNATIMNLETWNSLPPSLQKIFDSLNSWTQKEMDAAQKTESHEAEDLLKEKGHTMIDLSEVEFRRFVESSRKLTGTIIRSLKVQGIPAKELAAELEKV